LTGVHDEIEFIAVETIMSVERNVEDDRAERH